MVRSPWLVASLSLLFPGLGQLYCGKIRKSGIWFLLFLLFLRVEGLQPFLMLVSFLAAWDGFKIAHLLEVNTTLSESKKKIRAVVYLATSMIAFCFWQEILFQRYTPVGNQVLIDRNVREIKKLLGQCFSTYQKIPEDLGECIPTSGFQEGVLVDPWASAYIYTRMSDTKVEIRSLGPDKKIFTNDDFVYIQKLP